jgi:hypothetical protein
MLTVSAKRRADIEDICSHWWVNEGYSISCLEVADELARQTPVRLDLLLSIAPAPKSSDKLVVDGLEDGVGATAAAAEVASGARAKACERTQNDVGAKKQELPVVVDDATAAVTPSKVCFHFLFILKI